MDCTAKVRCIDHSRLLIGDNLTKSVTNATAFSLFVYQINACVKWKEDKWVVVITHMDLRHNHEVTKIAFKQYAVNRLAISDDVLETVDLLRKSGAKKKSIQRYILENSDASPNPRDVSNIIKKLKSREKGDQSTAQRLRAWIKEFCEEEPGNIGRIFTDQVNDKV